MRILYVDDEELAIRNFEHFINKIDGITKVTCTTSPMKAIDLACINEYDVAFLDIEMPDIRGIELGKRILNVQPNIEIIYVTSYEDHALAAFQIGAIGYILKPYDQEDIEKVLKKIRKVVPEEKVQEKDVSSNKKDEIFIKTFGSFDIFKNNELIPIKNAKAKEIFALLVDKKGGSMTPQMISNMLWEDREYDAVIKSYVWRAIKELKKVLDQHGIAHILQIENNLKSIYPETFLCDYYEILNGNEEYVELYNGYYMSQYSWAEETIPIIEAKIRKMKKSM